jgi:hypothetical protein
MMAHSGYYRACQEPTTPIQSRRTGFGDTLLVTTSFRRYYQHDHSRYGFYAWSRQPHTHRHPSIHYHILGCPLRRNRPKLILLLSSLIYIDRGGWGCTFSFKLVEENRVVSLYRISSQFISGLKSRAFLGVFCKKNAILSKLSIDSEYPSKSISEIIMLLPNHTKKPL